MYNVISQILNSRSLSCRWEVPSPRSALKIPNCSDLSANKASIMRGAWLYIDYYLSKEDFFLNILRTIVSLVHGKLGLDETRGNNTGVMIVGTSILHAILTVKLA
jgi:hypothetical protein